MFRPQDIKDRTREKPFRPFRIVTSAGEYYDVYHPDLIMVGTRDVIVGTASSDDPSIHDRSTYVALMHITAVEPLPLPAEPPTGNGQQ